MTQSDPDTSNDMSDDDVCAISWKGTKLAREQVKRDRMDQEHGIVGKELMNGRAAREMMEARSAPRAANLIGTVTRTKGAMARARARAKARVKLETATTVASKGTSE